MPLALVTMPGTTHSSRVTRRRLIDGRTTFEALSEFSALQTFRMGSTVSRALAFMYSRLERAMNDADSFGQTASHSP
jgi:hypothetical protein